MISKTYIKDRKDFEYLCKQWKKGSFIKHHIGQPKEFPCVAIAFKGHSTDIYIDTFVYLSDFIAERIDEISG